MPMTFPDFQSLKERATQRNFRQPLDGETEDQYRAIFADFMQKVDMVEAGEIRLGAIPMDLVREADPVSALAAIMGTDRKGVNSLMDDLFGKQ